MENDHGSEQAEAAGETSQSGTPLEVYEWAGGILAALGFFLSPVPVAIPAGYCALKLRGERGYASVAIVVVLFASGFFWTLFLFANDLATLLVADGVTSALPVVALAVGLVSLFVLLAGLAYVLLAR